MIKLLTLLKYADPEKMTAEAVTEVLSSFKIHLTKDRAAEIAQALKTRGLPGLLPYVPELMAARQDAIRASACCVLCPRCGQMVEISEVADSETRKEGN